MHILIRNYYYNHYNHETDLKRYLQFYTCNMLYLMNPLFDPHLVKDEI